MPMCQSYEIFHCHCCIFPSPLPAPPLVLFIFCLFSLSPAFSTETSSSSFLLVLIWHSFSSFSLLFLSLFCCSPWRYQDYVRIVHYNLQRHLMDVMPFDPNNSFVRWLGKSYLSCLQMWQRTSDFPKVMCLGKKDSWLQPRWLSPALLDHPTSTEMSHTFQSHLLVWLTKVLFHLVFIIHENKSRQKSWSEGFSGGSSITRVEIALLLSDEYLLDIKFDLGLNCL